MGAPDRLGRTRDRIEEAPRWAMRRRHITPRYTTRWDELATARV